MIPFILQTFESEDNHTFIKWLYHSYVRLMYKEISKYASLRSAKFDIVQDTLVKLYPHLDYLRTLDRDKLTNYIIKTTNSAAIDYIRQEARHGSVSYIENFDSGEEEAAELDVRLMAIENVAAFRAAWNELDEKAQQLVHRKLVLQQTDAEIAEALGIASSSVHSLVWRARKKFIAIFSAQNP